jgi:Ner family transcriptional regulator
MNTTSHPSITNNDWHPADIKAALAKKSYSFARIARENGYVENSPNMVLHKAWPQIEEIISGILGIKAAAIWPSRYDRHGKPLRGGKGRIIRKHQSSAKITRKRTRLNV